MRYAMTVEIDRPIEEVWAWMGDIFNAPRLRGMSLGGRQTSKGPIGVGSTYEFRAMVLGFETVIVGEVTEWDPPHASTATASGRPVKSFRLRETFERIPTGTGLSEISNSSCRSRFACSGRSSARWCCAVGGPPPRTSSD